MNQNKMPSLFSISEIELSYKNKVHPNDRIRVSSSKSAYDVFMAVWDMNKIELIEQFSILLLDRQNKCIGVSNVSTGGTAACIVDPKIIFATALKANASSIILAHNHPSGTVEPSKDDIKATNRLMEAGKILEVFVLDHLIVSCHNYYSFLDQKFTSSQSEKWDVLVG